MARLQREVLEAEKTLRASELESSDDHLDLAVLDAQRGALVEAGQRGILESDAVEERLADIDDQLLKIREKEH